jgi:RNA polymerase sigma-70 factor (ECF subfamily)
MRRATRMEKPGRPGQDGGQPSAPQWPDEAAFVELRGLLFSIAYQMTGSVVDAEDTVSESYIRLRSALQDGREIRNLRQYMATTVTRLSIDLLRSARVRREAYVGPWLPEPLIDADSVLEFERVELADTLSMAFLVLLESLSPTERAVFLLREVFEFDYPEVARILDMSQASCRQLLHRAKQQVEARKPRFDVDAEEREELATRFFAAIQDGDLGPLVTMLAEDVVAYGDGGGKGPSLPRPVFGREKVLRLLAPLARTAAELKLRIERTSVNGQPGALVRAVDGRLLNVLSIDIVDGTIQTVRSVINSEKLHHLGPLVDAADLAGEAAARRQHH